MGQIVLAMIRWVENIFDQIININRNARESGHLRFVGQKTQIPAFAGMICYKGMVSLQNDLALV
jgi:hypothetical protein